MNNFKRATFGMSVFIALLCLCGCGGTSTQEDNKDSEVEHYKCTDAQIALVEKEVEICKKTSYFSSYCFRQAKKTQCSKLNEKLNAAEQ